MFLDLNNHKFFQLSKWKQVALTSLLLSLAIVLAYFWFYLLKTSRWYLLTLPVLVLISPIVERPLSILSGVKIYYSPLLVVWGKRDKTYQMHLGTLFDYLMVLDFKTKGQTFKTQILVYTFQGVLNIIDELKRTNKQDALVVGTSYFLSKSTAERFNFKTKKATIRQIIFLGLNYLNLVLLLSIADRKLRFPNIFNAMMIEIDAISLIKEEEKIKSFYNYMKRRLRNNTSQKLSKRAKT